MCSDAHSITLSYLFNISSTKTYTHVLKRDSKGEAMSRVAVGG